MKSSKNTFSFQFQNRLFVEYIQFKLCQPASSARINLDTLEGGEKRKITKHLRSCGWFSKHKVVTQVHTQPGKCLFHSSVNFYMGPFFSEGRFSSLFTGPFLPSFFFSPQGEKKSFFLRSKQGFPQTAKSSGRNKVTFVCISNM